MDKENEKLREQYKCYKTIICKADDMLPDALEIIDQIMDDEYERTDEMKETYDRVRIKMIEDGRTEMEIVAFFEGIALNEVKTRSLQSQIDSLNSVMKTNSSLVGGSGMSMRNLLRDASSSLLGSKGSGDGEVVARSMY